MKLFYQPGACSLANHIALREAGLNFELSRVSRGDKRTEDGRDFRSINPKGYVPALELSDGTVLTENLAIQVYVAERSGRLLAKEGSARWRALEALAFMTSEIHGNFKPIFAGAELPAKEQAETLLVRHFTLLDGQLGDRPFLIGEEMTIADCYLFVMLFWADMKGITISDRLAAYREWLRGLPSVGAALAAEALA
ncbi:glutathione S-transferase C-terminal domain-containing protein [Rhizobium sp. AB2/73]|uniref:glutathione S-transferase C-terminal domain-containing protein n=1 Tax=Rhizobium sp. AB2/73 TaxID=2795216 RepID=UPI001C603B7B|nr:glutathione S-transferase C-terminal domain-containing protein [Rhizobium sp. AB2/73]QYA11949.1 glutathione S-transferase C-terminal domain-containing protein [Rhizobium sp. AB2/73]UEQ82120.1 glutathione S-transferase C-terminal domain-containing protein [Rhizobium sp. AB2/73]